MIYVPDIENYKCFYVQSENVIRAYEQIPQHNTTINYRDYYINSNYIFKDGIQTFNQYSSLPICLSNTLITNDFYYRNDIDSILIIFLIFCIFAFYLPLKLFSRFVRRV